MNTTHALPMAGLKLLSLREVAALLCVAHVTVYRLVSRRLLPVYRIAHKLKFREEDVRDWLERRRTDSIDQS